ncbi:MAG: 50S ribosomal protein L3, partial [Spartobacteria bacterium]|nr:50S ribosomal protein L3 [Spartobacteria bacterium]
MSIGLLGKKLGMTRIYDEKGRVSPATVIAAGGNRILQTKSIEKDKYTSVQVGFDDQKPQRVGKAMTGHFAKTESTAKRFIREFRLADNAVTPESAELPVTNFEVGQFVDVIGQSKGKGFQGTIKRHNFAGQPMTHGSTMHRR